ncbi:MAG TPA: hypothetical protein PKH11_16110, partial [Planctomycetota bacterium]|nr:hypothetical protein [Planctomycetota bacterium]
MPREQKLKLPGHEPLALGGHAGRQRVAAGGQRDAVARPGRCLDVRVGDGLAQQRVLGGGRLAEHVVRVRVDLRREVGVALERGGDALGGPGRVQDAQRLGGGGRHGVQHVALGDEFGGGDGLAGLSFPREQQQVCGGAGHLVRERVVRFGLPQRGQRAGGHEQRVALAVEPEGLGLLGEGHDGLFAAPAPSDGQREHGAACAGAGRVGGPALRIHERGVAGGAGEPGEERVAAVPGRHAVPVRRVQVGRAVAFDERGVGVGALGVGHLQHGVLVAEFGDALVGRADRHARHDADQARVRVLRQIGGLVGYAARVGESLDRFAVLVAAVVGVELVEGAETSVARQDHVKGFVLAVRAFQRDGQRDGRAGGGVGRVQQAGRVEIGDDLRHLLGGAERGVAAAGLEREVIARIRVADEAVARRDHPMPAHAQIALRRGGGPAA